MGFRSRPVLAVATAIVVLGAVAGCGNGGRTSIRRALAAIGAGRIMHVVTESPSGAVYVDLKTGKRTAPVVRDELWVDRRGVRLHLVVSENGHVVGDLLYPQDAAKGMRTLPSSPSLGGLWTGYRTALSNGTAKLVGRGTSRGRPVYWLRFKTTNPAGSKLPKKDRPTLEVAVDAHTYKPVVYRTLFNGAHFDERVLVAETIAYDPADFKRRGPDLLTHSVSFGHSASTEIGSGTIDPNLPPKTVVHAPWLTAGTTAAGIRLAAVTPLTETTQRRGKKTSTKGLELAYGPLSKAMATSRSTTIEEVRHPHDSLWAHVPSGSIQIEVADETTSSETVAHPHPRNRTYRIWTGYLRDDGLYITIATPKGERALLAIARSLRPARR